MEILIWQRRTEKGITLNELEQMTSISKSSLSNYENGKCVPDICKLESIAKALNIRITDLFESDYK